MGCGAAEQRPNKPTTTTTHFACRLKTELGEEIVVQPLGIFGELAFSAKITYELKRGKAYCLGEDKIYFSGGEETPTEFAEIELNFVTKKARLTFKPIMLNDRTFHQIVAVNDSSIVALGGINKLKEGFLRSCEMYSTLRSKWVVIADMPSAKCGMGVAAFSGKFIYTFGGYLNIRDVSTSIESFDLTRNQWTTLAVTGDTLAKKHGKLAMQVDINSIIVFGGEQEGEEVPTYLFSPEKKTLQKVEQTEKTGGLRVESALPVSFYKGRVYVMDPMSAHCFVYSVKKQCWNSVPVNMA